MSITSVPGRLRQEDCEFKAYLGYIVRLCQKRKKGKEKRKEGRKKQRIRERKRSLSRQTHTSRK
jgi:hypothetical protein